MIMETVYGIDAENLHSSACSKASVSVKILAVSNCKKKKKKKNMMWHYEKKISYKTIL